MPYLDSIPPRIHYGQWPLTHGLASGHLEIYQPPHVLSSNSFCADFQGFSLKLNWSLELDQQFTGLKPTVKLK